MTDIIAIGNLPPPIHGQSLATERMIDMLRSCGFILTVRDIGPRNALLPRTLLRLVRHASAAWSILRSPAAILYLSVNNGLAMILGAILCLCGRLSGKAIALHHHSLSYVTTPSAAMRLLVRAAGSEALHIAQSETIGSMMIAAYRLRHCLGYSNIGIVEGAESRLPVDVPTVSVKDYITLGYLANVTAEKGIYVLLDTFYALKKMYINLRLIVAGPCRDPEIISAMEEARLHFGSDFIWIGAVYATEKQAFFDSIDIFAFPTLYATETQGMVNLEALGAGVPVVAFNRGRIGQDIGQTGGVAVSIDADFTTALSAFLARFDRGAMSAAARARYSQLLHDHEVEKAQLLHWIRQHLLKQRSR